MRELDEFVFTNAESIEFFQLVRLLHQLYPERKAVGEYSSRLDQEVARFAVPPTLAFPAGEVAQLDRPVDGEPPRMLVNFMGLVGPEGVLPLEYTLLVDERARRRDTGLRDFLDIFHHRMVSLFYRAWEKTHFFAARERGKQDRLFEHVADLAGIGAPEIQATLPLDTESLLYYAGLLAPHQRSAAALEQLISDYFEVDATVVQFTGRWYNLDAPTQCALGEDRDESGQLGLGAVVGDAVYDPQAGVRIRLGPLSRGRYDDFLPGAAARQTLRDLVRFFAGDHLDVELQLVLKADDVPYCHLGEDHETPLALGWYTWLHTSGRMSRDPDDTVLSL